MAAPIITLTSDWGISDFYIGALKGRLLSLAPESVLIDISHQIERSNQLQGAFVLRNVWKRFPKGTVHTLMVVGSGNNDSNLLVIKFDGHFFCLFFKQANAHRDLTCECKFYSVADQV